MDNEALQALITMAAVCAMVALPFALVGFIFWLVNRMMDDD